MTLFDTLSRDDTHEDEEVAGTVVEQSSQESEEDKVNCVSSFL